MTTKITAEQVFEAVNDRDAVRRYLESRIGYADIPVSDPCGCIFHGYLTSRFGPDEICVAYHQIDLTFDYGGEDETIITAVIEDSFAERIQQTWVRMAYDGLTDDGYREKFLDPGTAIAVIERDQQVYG